MIKNRVNNSRPLKNIIQSFIATKSQDQNKIRCFGLNYIRIKLRSSILLNISENWMLVPVISCHSKKKSWYCGHNLFNQHFQTEVRKNFLVANGSQWVWKVSFHSILKWSFTLNVSLMMHVGSLLLMLELNENSTWSMILYELFHLQKV